MEKSEIVTVAINVLQSVVRHSKQEGQILSNDLNITKKDLAGMEIIYKDRRDHDVIQILLCTKHQCIQVGIIGKNYISYISEPEYMVGIELSERFISLGTWDRSFKYQCVENILPGAEVRKDIEVIIDAIAVKRELSGFGITHVVER